MFLSTKPRLDVVVIVNLSGNPGPRPADLVPSYRCVKVAGMWCSRRRADVRPLVSINSRRRDLTGGFSRWFLQGRRAIIGEDGDHSAAPDTLTPEGYRIKGRGRGGVRIFNKDYL